MDDLERLRHLSGINSTHSITDGSNISITGDQKGELMKKNNIRPGTPEWFKLWFSKPYLTGENPI